LPPDKVLIISTNAGIDSWRRQDVALAYGLRKAGKEVTVLNCEGYQDTCSTKIIMQDSWDKNEEFYSEICKRCQKISKFYNDISKIDTTRIDEFTSKDDEKEIESFFKDNNIYSKRLRFKGVLVYKAAAFHIINNFKVKEVTFRSKNIIVNAFRKELKQTLINIISLKRIITKINPKIIIYNNFFYPLENITCQIANESGIESFYFFGSNNHTKLNTRYQIFRKNTLEYWKFLKSKYTDTIKLTEDDVLETIDHFETYLNAEVSYCFSERLTKSDVLNRIYNKTDKKLVLVTLSGEDELTISKINGYCKKRNNYFSDQLSCVQTILKFFNKKKKYFVIVRPHPRSFSSIDNNKRDIDFNKIEQLCKLNNAFYCSNNIKLSIYNILSQTDFHINMWSSTAIESNLLGIPVLTCFPDFTSYPPHIDKYLTKENNLHTTLESFLKCKHSISRVIKSIQWRSIYAKQYEFSLNESPYTSLSYDNFTNKRFELKHKLNNYYSNCSLPDEILQRVFHNITSPSRKQSNKYINKLNTYKLVAHRLVKYFQDTKTGDFFSKY